MFVLPPLPINAAAAPYKTWALISDKLSEIKCFGAKIELLAGLKGQFPW